MDLHDRLQRLEAAAGLVVPDAICAGETYGAVAAAKLLGISRSTLWAVTRQGDLRTYPTATTRRVYSGADLIAWRDRRAQ